MLENKKQITIVDEQGNEHLMQVLFTYDNEERKTSYVFFYSEENPDEVFAISILSILPAISTFFPFSNSIIIGSYTEFSSNSISNLLPF